jgi:glycolate oxidase iron-sulfur subunit
LQTQFTLAQLADPQVAESERILRTCVHCGFCTATCPTYVLDGDELDSPRGRIYLIKDMLEFDRPASPEVVKHVDRCLSCLACMTTCPSGVHYMHLVDHARARIEATYTRPRLDRWLRALLARVLPDNVALRRALRLARLAKPFAGLFAALGLKPLAALLGLAPGRLPPGAATANAASGRRVIAAEGVRKGRVALLSGCVHHLGRGRDALAAARANIDAWTEEIAGAGLDAILVTASGCGTTVKDYGFMLRGDSAYAAKAARVSALAADISEYLSGLELSPTGDSKRLIIAYHSACSLQHGQKIARQPKDLLCKMGFVVKDVPEGHLCCGSAGTYNILQPDTARRLRDRKVGNIEKLAPDVIAAGNIGCITQIAAGTAVPVVHTVELIDWATGGRKPAALEVQELR